MKTALGWIRGKLCGRPPQRGALPRYSCAHCGRFSDEPEALCYPVKIE
jgi:hypothetical protein